jgi:hypothetical protein
LTYLKNNPPKPNQACGISKHRKDWFNSNLRQNFV